MTNDGCHVGVANLRLGWKKGIEAACRACPPLDPEGLHDLRSLKHRSSKSERGRRMPCRIHEGSPSLRERDGSEARGWCERLRLPHARDNLPNNSASPTMIRRAVDYVDIRWCEAGERSAYRMICLGRAFHPPRLEHARVAFCSRCIRVRWLQFRFTGHGSCLPPLSSFSSSSKDHSESWRVDSPFRGQGPGDTIVGRVEAEALTCLAFAFFSPNIGPGTRQVQMAIDRDIAARTGISAASEPMRRSGRKCRPLRCLRLDGPITGHYLQVRRRGAQWATLKLMCRWLIHSPQERH